MSETNSAASPGPGRPRSLSPATEKTIARRYARGDWTLAGLAEHYGISVSTVRAIVRRNPIETAPAAEPTDPEQPGDFLALDSDL